MTAAKPLDVFALERPYREALASFQALRRVGFKAEDVFFAAAPAVEPGEPMPADPSKVPMQVCVELRAQGKSFTLTCGHAKGSAAEIEATWQDLAQHVVCGAVTDAQIESVCEESEIFRRRGELLGALTIKGFVLPSVSGPEHWPS